MHERTVFTRKRTNACPEELPVHLAIKVKHYIAEGAPYAVGKKPGYRIEEHVFSATSKQALDVVVSAIFKIKVNHQIYYPGRTQNLVINITGTIGDNAIDLVAKNVLVLQKQVCDLEFTKPAYEHWALKLRKL